MLTRELLRATSLTGAAARVGARCFASKAPTGGPVILQPCATRPSNTVTHWDLPSAAGGAGSIADDIAEAQRTIFGFVKGNNARSGRKALRRHLKGPAVKAYYPVDIHHDLNLVELGIENPAVEDRYRRNVELQRIGKTLRKGKVRPLTQRFATRMALEDKQEEVLDQLDYFYPEDALPEDDVINELLDGMNEVGATRPNVGRECTC